jgi:uncharacterized damage-inducible protein DinB
MSQQFFELVPLPQIASPELAVLAAALVEGTREWREEMNLVPTTPEAMQYRVRPNGHSAGSVLAHIAYVEARWMSRLGCPFTSDEGERLGCHLTNVDEAFWADAGGDYQAILDWQDEVRLRTLACLIGLDADQVTEFRDGQPDYTAAWVVNHLIGHEAYHAGQAVLLASLSTAE